jgi:TonB-linked SusC/RagA family outer membrane protein
MQHSRTSRCRLVSIAFGIILTLASFSGYGQKVTLSVKNAPLTQIFAEIQRQTGYYFAYTAEVLQGTIPVTIKFKNEPLEEALTKCMKGQSLTYAINNKVISIKKLLVDQPAQKSTSTPIVGGRSIIGTVTDTSGQPLSGATIIVKGTNIIVSTNADGNFALSGMEPDFTLVVSFVGYDSHTTHFPEGQGESHQHLTIALQRHSNPLDEVQIIAYGSNTRRYNVGSVATVNSDQIEKQPLTNPLLALEAQVPGLAVNPVNGAPGASVNIQIRGQNSLGNGYDQPLFVIDGVPFAPQNNNVNQLPNLVSGANNAFLPPAEQNAGLSPFSTINPLDIESITILKDADATSIYGSQGANGVILITTKKGKAGKTAFDLNVQSGPVRDTRHVQMLTTTQYLDMQRQAMANDLYGTNARPSEYPNSYPSLTIFDPNRSINFYNTLFGGTANNTVGHASLSGGTANTTFLVSLGDALQTYNFPGGFAKNTYTMHSSFHHSSPDHKLSLDFGTDFAYDHNNVTSATSILSSFTLPPNTPDLLDAKGNLIWNYKGIDLQSSGITNPYSYLKQPYHDDNYNLNTHLNVGYQLIDGLRLIAVLGYSRFNTQEFSAMPLGSFDPIQGQSSSAIYAASTMQTMDVAPQISYDHKLSKGQLSVVVGGEYKKDISSSNQTQGYGYSNDALLGTIDAAQTVYSYDSYELDKYDGVFGRIGYTWKRKYILNVTGRRDGSSNFGPGRQFGNFGSAAAGWIFTEEPFLKSWRWLSFGKINISYGTQGGNGVQPYQYQPNWASGGSQNLYLGVVPYGAGNLYNPNYSWDVLKKINAGLSLGFLDNRILVDFAFYQNRSGNQLISYSLPAQTGFSGVTENSPALVQNRGLELTLNTINFKTKDFTWTSSFNISGNRNKLLAFPGLAQSSYANFYVIGKPTNIIMAYKYLGVNPATGLFQFRSANGQPTSFPVQEPATSLGNPGDEFPVVDPNPKFFGGFTNTFTYKGFSVMLLFSFTKQIGTSYIADIYANNQLPGKSGVNLPTAILGHVWEKPGDVAQFERLSSGFYPAATQGGFDFTNSSGAYTDASYIKLRNVSLSWTTPQKVARKIGMQRANIYVNAQNLFTITHYAVLDPELNGQLYGFPLQRIIVAGLNLTF